MYRIQLALIVIVMFCISCEQEPQDVQQPNVLILNPAESSKIRVDSTFKVIVQANDNVGIQNVILLIDGEETGSDTSEPFEFEIEESLLAIGNHTLFAKAYDPSGNIGTSELINIEITEKPQNVLTGKVSNILGEGIFGAVVRVVTSDKKATYNVVPFFDSTSNMIGKGDLIGDISTYYVELTASNVIASSHVSEVIDSAITNSDGKYELHDLLEGEYQVEIIASGYENRYESVEQKEGVVEYDYILSMLDDLQVSNIQVEDKYYSIKVSWNPISLSTITGYNIYEQHVFFYELEGKETATHIQAIYSDWKKVNNSPIQGDSFEFESEEYNVKYGVCVVPVNIAGVESVINETTYRRYLDTEFNRRHFGLFSLTSLAPPIYIEDNTHEYALHMRFFYNQVPFGVNDWEVYISENGTSWIKLGELGTGEGQPANSLQKNDYGYYQSISLNRYKGKTVYFKTNPESGYIQMELENFIGEYSQDGSGFEPFENLENGTVNDIDGNIYNYQRIGAQWWMTENLKVTHYSNGYSIPLADSLDEWMALLSTNKAYCWYLNDISNKETFGALYTWAAAMNGEGSSDSNPSGVQGVCPDGWHLPSDDEWKQLEMYLGMSHAEADEVGWRGTDEGGKLKISGTDYWKSPNGGATNESGFKALPGGFRFNDEREFNPVGERAFFWGSTFNLEGSGSAIGRGLKYENGSVYRNNLLCDQGFSVRCLKNQP